MGKGAAVVVAAVLSAGTWAGAAGAGVLAEPLVARPGATVSVNAVSNVSKASDPVCTSEPNATDFKISPEGVSVTGPGRVAGIPAGSLTVAIPSSVPPFTAVVVSWSGNDAKCTSWNGSITIQVRGEPLLGGPAATIGPRRYSPFERLLKDLILDDYECLKAYSDTCTTEQAYLLAAWYVFGGYAFKAGGNVVLKPVWRAIGPELTALLKKYGEKMAAGNGPAIAAFREELARLLPQALRKLPPETREQALKSLLPVLNDLPPPVQRQLVAMRFTIPPAQLGKKSGQHMGEWGLNPKSAADRRTFQNIITDIVHSPTTEVAEGEFQSQGAVYFLVKGNDVVVASKATGAFVTILKNGVTQQNVKRAFAKS